MKSAFYATLSVGSRDRLSDILKGYAPSLPGFVPHIKDNFRLLLKQTGDYTPDKLDTFQNIQTKAYVPRSRFTFDTVTVENDELVANVPSSGGLRAVYMQFLNLLNDHLMADGLPDDDAICTHGTVLVLGKLLDRAGNPPPIEALQYLQGHLMETTFHIEGGGIWVEGKPLPALVN